MNNLNISLLHTRHDDVDLVIIRENTEGEYSHIEHEVCICNFLKFLSCYFLTL